MCLGNGSMTRKTGLLLITLIYINAIIVAQTPPTKESEGCVGNKMFLSCGISTTKRKSIIRVKEILYGQSPSCGQTARNCVVSDNRFHLCTGVQSCVFNTPSTTIRHCGLSNYAKVKYQCLEVSQLKNICSQQRRITSSGGYLVTPGYPTILSLQPSQRCVSTFVQPRGWIIRVYVLDFGQPASDTGDEGCEVEVTFRDILPREKGYLPQVSVCLNDKLPRDKLLYESASSVMQVAFFTTKNGIKADKIGGLFYYEGLGPGMKPSLVTEAPPSGSLPQPVRTIQELLPSTQTNKPSDPDDSMIILARPDIHIGPYSPHSERTDTTKPATLYITNSTGTDYSDLLDPHDGNITYFDDIAESGDWLESPEPKDNKWASIVGGTMFGLAMMLLLGILIIMVIEKHKALQRQRATSNQPTATIGKIEGPIIPSSKVNGLSHLDGMLKPHQKGHNKLHKGYSNNGFSSDGERYEGRYKKGRYWDKATETDTSSIEGDNKTVTYEDYNTIRTVKDNVTDPNGNIPCNTVTVKCELTGKDNEKKVGFHKFHVENEDSKIPIEGLDNAKNNTNYSKVSSPAKANKKIVVENNDKCESSTDQSKDTKDVPEPGFYEVIGDNQEKENGTSSESLTTVSNLDGETSLHLSSVLGSTESLEGPSKVPQKPGNLNLSSMINKFETVAAVHNEDKESQCRKKPTRKAKSNLWHKPVVAPKTDESPCMKNGVRNGTSPTYRKRESLSTHVKPSTPTKASPTLQKHDLPIPKESPVSHTKSSPRRKTKMSPSRRSRELLSRQQRSSPRASPTRTGSGARKNSLKKEHNTSGPAAGTHKEEQNIQEEPSLSSYSIYYSRSDFKRSLPNFNNPKRTQTRPPPPTYPPPKPTSQKPSVKPKPVIKHSQPVSNSYLDISRGCTVKGFKQQAKDSQPASSPNRHDYIAGTTLLGSYNPLLPQRHHNPATAGVQDSLSPATDDDLEIIDNDIYPSTDFGI